MKRLFVMLLLMGGLWSLTSLVLADVNNFSISQFEIYYFLDRDEEGRSTLHVIEKITADFPPFEQNKGLVREIPRQHNNRSVSFSLLSLERNNQPEPIYDQYTKNGYQVIETGTDEYLLGPQTYTFTYSLRDVTNSFDDPSRDEFYWDTNGTGWRVPIDRLLVRLHLSETLIPLFNGDTACYQGLAGSNERCLVSQNGGVFTASATNLQPQENLTLAIGFIPDSFTAYQASFSDKLTNYFIFLFLFGLFFSPITAPTSLIVIWWSIYRWRTWTNRQSELGAITAQYLPPPDTSVTVASSVLNKPHAIFTAQLLDLAVRNYIKIIETKEKTFWRSAEYKIEITGDVSKLNEEEQEILTDMFGTHPKEGQQLELKTLRNNIGFFMRLNDNTVKFKKLIRNHYGLRVKDGAKTQKFKRSARWCLIFGLLTLSPFLLFASAYIYILGSGLWPLSDKGLALRRHLKGLKLYISMAEEERMKILQSPTGAEKINIKDDEESKIKIIKLYEKILPYAVLFKKEKDWDKQLGGYYQSFNTSPGWYSGRNQMTNASDFGFMINNFSTSVSQTSASSSGGSSGGGSSGGGGGGGGGGGR